MNDMLVNDLLARIAMKLKAPAGMWGHDCREECGLIWTACGQECNWCGSREAP